MDTVLGRSSFSSAFVVSGLIHLGLVAFLVFRSFAPDTEKTNIGLIGNFIEAQTPFGHSPLTRPTASKREKRQFRRENPPVEAVPGGVEQVPDPARATQSATESGASLSQNQASGTGGIPSQGQYDEYTRDVLRMIHQKKIYPRMAQKMGHTGKVRVRLRIARDGSVLQSEVVEESRYSTLNEAARKLLGELGQLKPFPAEVSEKYWVFHVPIEYKL